VKGHTIPFFGLCGTKTLWLLLGTMFVLLCIPCLANAQAGRGSISGVVSDPSGAVVSGAKVAALNRATGVTLHTVTSEAGLYSFISLNPGTYVVTISQKGFQNFAQNNVPVTVDQDTTVNIALTVGNMSETVEVTATSELADTSNSTVGQLIEASTIERVPMLTRNVFDLIQMSAGVTPANGTPNSSSSYAITNISSGRPGVDVSSYTVNGAIQGSVYYMLDGSPLGIAENNIAAVIPAMEIPEDGVDELRVETQNTPASYQSGGAGVISLASKSGGDEFHGDAFGVFRPDILSANEYFNKADQILAGAPNKPPAFHRYQEGGAIGGPILHKKLFFFGDYEDTQQALFDPSGIFSVPTTAERNGDFSALLNNVDPNTSLPAPIVIYNPLAADNSDGTRQAFPGNNLTNYIDPTTGSNLVLNPIALKMLSMMPKCNYPNPSTCDSATNLQDQVNNFRFPGLDPTKAHRFDVRMDYNINDKQRLFGRFSFDRLSTATVNAFGNMWDPYYAQNITNGRNFLVGYDYTISPTTVLQLRYSFTRHYEAQGGDPRQNGFDITSLGFPSSLAAAQAYKTLPIAFFDDLGGGVGGTCCYNTFIFASENHDASATLTKVLGKHELSFGAEFMKRFMNQGQPPASSGSYDFELSATDQSTTPVGPSGSPIVGGNDFASFLLGMGGYPGYEGGNFTQDLFVASASPYYAAFIQDTYHVTKKLTITAGLRWDIFGGKTERHNRLEYFDPTATGTDPNTGLSFTGGEVFATNGNRSPFTTNMKDFGPRLGLAWNAMQRLVIRAGAGFYYGPSVQMVSGAGENSDGYSTYNNWNATCYNGDVNSPGGLGNSVFNGTNQCAGAATGSPAPSVTGVYSLSNPFPTGLVPASQLRPSGLTTGLGGSLNTMLRSQPTPVTYNYNFGLDYELPHQVVLSAAYVGSRGLFLPLGSADLNQLTLSQIQQIGATTNDPAVFMAAEAFPQFTTGGINGGVAVHGYPGGDSDYSSLQTKVQKRMTKHFTTLASFTWAKLITDDGNPPLGFVGYHAGAPQDWRDMSYEHSVSPQDVKYQFTWHLSYDLPIGEGRGLNLNNAGNAILGGWTVNAIYYLSSGLPIAAPVVGNNIYFNQRTDIVCDPSKAAPHTAAVWFNSSCFAAPTSSFIPGTAPAYLDHVRTMGANNLDMTLSKTVKLGEKRDLRFDVSSYNVANKAQMAAPNVSSLSSGFLNFGNITQTINTPRQFQFGARFTF
jgi:Carboxypeptidase regulatory-like domain